MGRGGSALNQCSLGAGASARGGQRLQTTDADTLVRRLQAAGNDPQPAELQALSARLCRRALAEPEVLQALGNRMYAYGLSDDVAGGSRPSAALTNSAAEIAGSALPEALARDLARSGQGRPSRDELPPPAVRAEAIAKRMAVEEVGELLPTELHQRGEEAITRLLADSNADDLRTTMQKLGFTPGQAARHMRPEDWEHTIQVGADTDIRTHVGARGGFRAALGETLHFTVRPRANAEDRQRQRQQQAASVN